MPSEEVQVQSSWSWTTVACTWESLGIAVVVGTLIYILARSVFDTIFFVVLAIILFVGIVWAYLRCCAGGSSSKSDAGEYQPIPNSAAV